MPATPTIQIKRSQVTATPGSLAYGELAYSESSLTLFVGDHSSNPISIGGAGTYAKLASPALTGAPTAPTATATDNTTTVATTAFVKTVVASATYLPTLDAIRAPAANLAMNGFRVTGAADPISPQDLATKNYTDNIASGVNYHAPVKAATTAALAANTYSNGSSGVGATLTANANGALAAVDGVTLLANDRLLVKNEAAGANDGIYVVTQVGDASHPWILTRAGDLNATANVQPGSATFVETGGTTNGAQGYLLSGTGPYTIGTTALAFVQFSGTGDLLAGTGIAISGNTVAVSGSYAGQGTIITVGTIGTGTWQGTAIGAGYGGTGLNTYAAGDLVYASGTSALARLAAGTAGYVLTVSGGLPAWTSTIDGGSF